MIRAWQQGGLTYECIILSVCAMVCMALEQSNVFAQSDLKTKKQWLETKNKAIRKNMLLDAERECLMEEMERAEI